MKNARPSLVVIVRHVLVRVVAEGIGAVLGDVVVGIVGSIVMDVVVTNPGNFGFVVRDEGIVLVVCS